MLLSGFLAKVSRLSEKKRDANAVASPDAVQNLLSDEKDDDMRTETARKCGIHLTAEEEKKKPPANLDYEENINFSRNRD